MNKIDFKEGGFPLNTDTLVFMQETYSKGLKALAAIGGDNYILTGCTGNVAVSDGYVVINGELLPFKGGTKTKAGLVLIRESVETARYEDSNPKNTYFDRYVEFGTGANTISWASLKRIKNLQALMAKIDSNQQSLTKKVDSNQKALTEKVDSNQKALTTKINSNQEALTEKVDSNHHTIPKGLISMWSGARVPDGWALCNGANGTPNLQNRFIMGASEVSPIGTVGGLDRVVLTVDEMPKHAHAKGTMSIGTNNHRHSIYAKQGIFYGQDTEGIDEKGGGASTFNKNTHDTGYSDYERHGHTLSGSTSQVGKGEAIENRPPFYALAFIIKL